MKLRVIIIKSHQQGIMEEKKKHKACTSRNIKEHVSLKLCVSDNIIEQSESISEIAYFIRSIPYS